MPRYIVSKEEALKPRVTRAGILFQGGFCNEEDTCTDPENREDDDCNAEVSRFPTQHHSTKPALIGSLTQDAHPKSTPFAKRTHRIHRQPLKTLYAPGFNAIGQFSGLG
jgi:hypothetical protein